MNSNETITKKQTSWLLRHGYPFKTVRSWTKQRASKEISELTNLGFENVFARAAPTIMTPEDKSAKTKGIPLVGRMTFRQQQFLIENGYNGDEIEKWTKYRAQKEIAAICGTTPILWEN